MIKTAGILPKFGRTDGSVRIHVGTADSGGDRQLVGRVPRAGHTAYNRQPPVSDLEKHLKTRLLNRSGRRLALTDAGRSYVIACRRILEDVREAERAASGEYIAPQGGLIVTAPIVFGRLHVLPVAIEFLKVYPDIDMRLVLADRLFNLLEDRVDLAIRIGALPDSSLKANCVGSIRYVVCASPAYFAKRGLPNSPLELSNHDCVTFEGLTSSDAWIFAINKSEKPVDIHSRLVVNTAEAAIDAAIAGVRPPFYFHEARVEILSKV